MITHNEREVFVESITMATVALGVDADLPIFVAPFDCFIERIYLTNAGVITGHDTNYNDISFQRKGAAGTGTDEIASKQYKDGVNAAAHVPNDIGALHKDYRYILKGNAVNYLKTHAASGYALTDPVFTIVYSRAPGGILDDRNYDGPYVSNVHTPDFGGATVDDEYTIFVAPFDSFLDKIYVTADAASDKPKWDFFKGPSGNGASIHANYNTALVERVPKDIGALDKDNRFVPKGIAVTAKEDVGTADAVVPIFTVAFRRA